MEMFLVCFCVLNLITTIIAIHNDWDRVIKVCTVIAVAQLVFAIGLL